MSPEYVLNVFNRIYLMVNLYNMIFNNTHI